MNLAFTTFEVAAIVLAVWIASSIVFDGESNWLEGAYLLVVYGMLAVAFYFFGFCLRFRLQRQRPTAPIRPAPRR